MDGLPSASPMRDLSRELIATLQEEFGEHVVGYGIEKVVDDPYPSLELSFEL